MSFSQGFPVVEDAEALLEQIGRLKAYAEKFSPIGMEQQGRLRLFQEIEWIYHSGLLEGGTLDFRETSLVVQETAGPEGRGLKDVLVALNQREALRYVREMIAGGQATDERELRLLHRIVAHGLVEAEPGRLRARELDAGAGRRRRVAGADEVQGAMRSFFSFCRENSPNLHPLELAAAVHQGIDGIAPFRALNGTLARLALNSVLLRHGYPLIAFPGEGAEREAYFQASDEGNIWDGDEVRFQVFLFKLVKKALWIAGGRIPEG